MNSIKGKPISPGAAICNVYLCNTDLDTIDMAPGKNEAEEKKRYQNAREEAVQQIEDIYQKMLCSRGENEAAILLAHKEIIEDIEFIGSVESLLSSMGCSAECAVKMVQDQYVEIFNSMDQEYMRERAADIRDSGMRIIRILQGKSTDILQFIKEPVILVGKELTPSDTAQLNPEMVQGIVNECGGVTSHAAIIARMLGIPFIVYPDITSIVKHGQVIAMDGELGDIELEIDETVRSAYGNKMKAIKDKKTALQKLVGTKSVTLDGFELILAGNIGLPRDAKQVIKQGGEAVGLFRTEFLYMDRENLPSEEEQFAAYKETAEAMSGMPVIIRTLDIGGDKALDYLEIPGEENPFLGCRAIRFCLSRITLWKTQLRALLCASAYGDIQIMFPMIVSMNELRKAKSVVEEVKLELRNEGKLFNESIKIGMMMETPAAAVMADIFAGEVDFFSIGTNDLVQYTMAVDRMNNEVAHLYSPYDPAVLRLVKNIADNAHRQGISVGICGEAAADKNMLPLWIGLGIDELSMSSNAILEIKSYIQSMSKSRCEKIADEILKIDTAAEIEATLANLFGMGENNGELYT